MSRRIRLHQGALLGGLVLLALAAFEMFNFSTTEFALRDLLGDLAFLHLRWATILAIAFCGIDFAGIARLFTPDEHGEHVETWYLFGAWFLAAAMNALLTWWGVSVALLEHVPQGTTLLGRKTLLTIVPVFVALMVWLVRVLLIGTIVMTGPRLFQWEWGKKKPGTASHAAVRTAPSRSTSQTSTTYVGSRPVRPSNGHVSHASSPSPEEPTYEPLAAAASQKGPKHLL